MAIYSFMGREELIRRFRPRPDIKDPEDVIMWDPWGHNPNRLYINIEDVFADEMVKEA